MYSFHSVLNIVFLGHYHLSIILTKIYFDSIINLVIVLQKLVKPATYMGLLRGSFFLRSYKMSTDNLTTKPFLTYTQQIEKLRSKGLLILDEPNTIKLLKKYSYFSLIGGYKVPFKNIDKTYKKHTSIDDILVLYTFDDDLRNLFLRYTLKIEKHIKSLISYAFCEEYGDKQDSYINATNYFYDNKNQHGINELIVKISALIKTPKKYPYIIHQENAHKNVPLWVIMNALTLGTVSKMYSFLPQSIQTKITKEFKNVHKTELSQMLDLLARARNVCAHNERFYNYRYGRSSIDDTKVHHLLHLSFKNERFTQGKNDLFAVVIIFKYLLDKEDFSTFCKDLDFLFLTLKSKTNQIQQPQLFRYMGFPENWREIEGC